MEYDLDILAVRQGDGGRPMLFSPLMNGTRIWMHRGERKRIGETCWCDMVSNAFLARRDTIARVRWDDEIKTYEHWEFFLSGVPDRTSANSRGTRLLGSPRPRCS